MSSSRELPEANPPRPSTEAQPVDLIALSDATGVPVDVLRTFAAISDPANKNTFSAESARKAFGGVRV